jgi:hypothetical protein
VQGERHEGKYYLIYFVAIKIIHCVSSSRTVDAQEKDVPPSRLADEWITRILLGDGRGQLAKGAYSHSPSRDIRDQPFAERFLLDLSRGMARVDNKPIDLYHPDQEVIIDL